MRESSASVIKRYEGYLLFMLTYTIRVAYALLRGAVSHGRRKKAGVPDASVPSGFKGKHASTFIAHPFDVDIQMHVNNAKYLHIAELTRWQRLTEDGLLTTALNNKWLFMARQCDIVYHRPIPPFTRYACTVETTHDSKKWITFKHQFVNLKTDELYAELDVLACIKLPSGKTVSPVEYEKAVDALLH